jgi:hypothetical protein
MSAAIVVATALTVGVLALPFWALSRAMPEGPRMVLAVAAFLTATGGLFTVALSGLRIVLGQQP